MSQQTLNQAEFWEGYRCALVMMNVELDKFLAKSYTDRRAQNDLLDLKNAVRELLHNGHD